MRFADRHPRRRPVAIAVVLIVALVLVAAAGAAREILAGHPKKQRVGGLTAVTDQSVQVVGGKTFKQTIGSDSSTKEIYPLYAGTKIHATGSGEAWFDVMLNKKKTI